MTNTKTVERISVSLPEHVAYRRIQHAAHYSYTNQPGYSGPIGHDMEEWDVRCDVRPLIGSEAAWFVPLGAEFHVGYIDKGGRQHWTFTKKAPLSESAVCSHCRLRRAR